MARFDLIVQQILKVAFQGNSPADTLLDTVDK